MEESPNLIAVRNVPTRWSLKQVISHLTPHMRVKFMVLAFENERGRGMPSSKIAYIRLPNYVNPDETLNKIKRVPVKNHGFIYGYLPTHVPQFVFACKGKTLNQKLAKKYRIQLEDRPHVVLRRTHSDILRELQTKYTGLYKLSASLDHRLMDSISQIVVERLGVVIKNLQQLSQHGLSRAYRSAHPHSGDFQMILSNLHRVEDELQCPRTQLTEADLTVLPTVAEVMKNVKSAYLKKSIEKIGTPVGNKVERYLDQLETNLPRTTEEQIATIEIREQLKRQAPYITQIFKEILQKQLVPTQDYKMRIYGVPFMPTRDVYTPLLQSLGAYGVARSKFSHNCLLLTIKPEMYAKFLQTDGTMLGGAKLVCRRSNVPLYHVPSSMLKQIKAKYGKADEVDDSVYEEEQDDDEDYPVEEEMD